MTEQINKVTDHNPIEEGLKHNTRADKAIALIVTDHNPIEEGLKLLT